MDSISAHALVEFGAFGALGLVKYIKLHTTRAIFEATDIPDTQGLLSEKAKITDSCKNRKE